MTIENQCQKFLKKRFSEHDEHDYALWFDRFMSGHPEMFMDNDSLQVYHDMLFKHHEPVPESYYEDGEATLMWIQNPVVRCVMRMVICEGCEHSTPHRYHNTKCKESKRPECNGKYDDCRCVE